MKPGRTLRLSFSVVPRDPSGQHDDREKRHETAGHPTNKTVADIPATTGLVTMTIPLSFPQPDRHSPGTAEPPTVFARLAYRNLARLLRSRSIARSRRPPLVSQKRERVRPAIHTRHRATGKVHMPSDWRDGHGGNDGRHNVLF